ncbi:MAG: thioredoxin-dependent thiol peroxidase, partial [Saprospiraceae bacterium]|nr:thioredoxin-dependent thiol peroxidase [Saprospiraceae bacterium]
LWRRQNKAWLNSHFTIFIHTLTTMSELKEGDVAPEFSAVNEKGETIRLTDYRGKKLVLYFYPKDDTPGCTAEACSLRDGYPRFQAQGYEILGVSPDSVKKHVKFQEKYNLPFNLLADEDHAVSEAYGVWGEKKFMGRAYMGINRTTFVIDENGKVARVIAKVDNENHSEQLLGS